MPMVITSLNCRRNWETPVWWRHQACSHLSRREIRSQRLPMRRSRNHHFPGRNCTARACLLTFPTDGAWDGLFFVDDTLLAMQHMLVGEGWQRWRLACHRLPSHGVCATLPEHSFFYPQRSARL
jgi:hypothetical protein